MDAPAIIRVDCLTCRQRPGAPAVLEDVSVSLHAGEILVIIGPHGCGKSALLHAMAGHLGMACVSGSVTSEAAARPGFRLLVQDGGRTLLPWLTLRANAGLRFDGAVSEPAHLDALGETLGFNLAAFDRFPHQARAAERQQAALLRTLLAAEGAVFLDEPLEALDPAVAADVCRRLAALARQRKLAAAWATVRPELAVLAADRFCVMAAGRVVATLENPARAAAPGSAAFAAAWEDLLERLRAAAA